MEYKAEYQYHVGNSTGTSVAMANNLDELITTIIKRGCQISNSDIYRLTQWDKYAESGDKYCIGWRVTIIKGESRMTEYTSL